MLWGNIRHEQGNNNTFLYNLYSEVIQCWNQCMRVQLRWHYYLMCVREHEEHQFLHDVFSIHSKEVLQLVHRHESADLKGKHFEIRTLLPGLQFYPESLAMSLECAGLKSLGLGKQSDRNPTLPTQPTWPPPIRNQNGPTVAPISHLLVDHVFTLVGQGGTVHHGSTGHWVSKQVIHPSTSSTSNSCSGSHVVPRSVIRLAVHVWCRTAGVFKEEGVPGRWSCSGSRLCYSAESSGLKSGASFWILVRKSSHHCVTYNLLD